MNDLNEKRVATRLILDTKITVIDQVQKNIPGKIKDLSATGAMIKTDRALTPESSCTLSITLKGNNSNLIIDRLHAKVVRTEGDTIGIEFDEKLEWLAIFYMYRNKLPLNVMLTSSFMVSQ